MRAMGAPWICNPDGHFIAFFCGSDHARWYKAEDSVVRQLGTDPDAFPYLCFFEHIALASVDEWQPREHAAGGGEVIGSGSADEDGDGLEQSSAEEGGARGVRELASQGAMKRPSAQPLQPPSLACERGRNDAREKRTRLDTRTERGHRGN